MKKINNKGFMLAEIVIVSTVICTCMIILYTGIYNLKSNFYITNRYYDLDSLYIAVEVNNQLKRSNFNFKDNLALYKENEKYQKFIDFYNNSSNYLVNVNIKQANVDELSDLDGLINNSYFQDYIKFLKNNIKNDDNKYLIIVEKKNKLDNNDCYYYTLELEYS